MFNKVKTAALAIAASGMAIATPAAAAPVAQGTSAIPAGITMMQPMGDLKFEHGRKKHKHWNRGRGYRQDYRAQGRYYAPRQAYYGERVHRNTRVWRARDGRYYCQKDNGTTGLLIGGAAGALIGRELAGRGDRTLGAILGAAGGALLGREIDSGGARCR
ncbi:glycine zipper 2TM domain-containing protein [Qipengyuania sp. DSG2-2]|uniref:glycine zipper 2TM domain-containing protein n=1 Tax=Qipengyuania sp. DGS2-2 TaxID=3349631 RepID=UPI0036D3AEE6